MVISLHYVLLSPNPSAGEKTKVWESLTLILLEPERIEMDHSSSPLYHFFRERGKEQILSYHASLSNAEVTPVAFPFSTISLHITELPIQYILMVAI